MKPGDKLTKLQVFDNIISNMNLANNDDLCDIWEASFGYCIDTRLKYSKDTDLFEVWEETNLN